MTNEECRKIKARAAALEMECVEFEAPGKAMARIEAAEKTRRWAAAWAAAAAWVESASQARID